MGNIKKILICYNKRGQWIDKTQKFKKVFTIEVTVEEKPEYIFNAYKLIIKR